MRPFVGFPTSFANQRASLFPHAGPASYTQVTATAGTVPITGGDRVQASEAGLKYFTFLDFAITDDGAFRVEPIPLVSSTNSAGQAPNGASLTYGLKWIALVTATVGGQAQTAGSEAAATTDLSGETVRLFGLGPN